MALVLFYHDHGPVSRLIQRVTHSPYNHVAIVLDDTLYEANSRGVTAVRGPEAWAIARRAAAVARIPLDPDDAAEARAFLEARVAKSATNRGLLRGYSVLGFIAAGLASLCPRLALVVTRPHEYICSGLVAATLQAAGELPDVEARIITPGDLADRLQPGAPPWTST